MPNIVQNLPLSKLQNHIKYRGMVRLNMLNEDDESLLCDLEWPKKSGKVYYACVATGLLFDKQSGRCLQSSKLFLLMDTVEESKCTRSQFEKWKLDRLRAASANLSYRAKPGPKPKGSAADDGDDDYDSLD